MTAGCWLHQANPTPAELFAPPMVWIDGRLDGRWRVERLDFTGVLDVRSATLLAPAGVSIDAPQAVKIAWPLERWDRTPTWLGAFDGRATDVQRDADGTLRLVAQDHWRLALQQQAIEALRLAASRLGAEHAASFLGGDAGNRSPEAFDLDGRSVYLPQSGGDGDAWTVTQAMRTLDAAADLQLNFDALPAAACDAVLPFSFDLDVTLEKLLPRLLDVLELRIVRTLRLAGDRWNEQRAVLPATAGPRVTLPTQAVVKKVKSQSQRAEVDAARQWIAQASRPVVEGTFVLQGGWAPASEGLGASEYARSTSSDFATLGQTYRRWVLNEDGRWSQPPFGRARTFDASTFFGQANAPATALRFASCLTLDDAGQPLPVRVDVSVDSGLTWQAYSGHVEMLTREAGVYLDDDALPSAVVTAALAGTLQLRVTGALRSPVSMSVERWRGNALRGLAEPLRLDAGQAFSLRRVDASSIHYAAVQTGAATSDERDDRRALRRWLLDRMQASRGATVRTEWTLADLWPWVRPGCRTDDAVVEETSLRFGGSPEQATTRLVVLETTGGA